MQPVVENILALVTVVLLVVAAADDAIVEVAIVVTSVVLCEDELPIVHPLVVLRCTVLVDGLMCAVLCTEIGLFAVILTPLLCAIER